MFLMNLKGHKALKGTVSGRSPFSQRDSGLYCFLTGLFPSGNPKTESHPVFPGLFALSWFFLQHVTNFCPLFYFLSPYKNAGFPPPGFTGPADLWVGPKGLMREHDAG